ncbi:MAG TPA: succinyl-diaminopimelate desuccinylase [Geminicoccaceae bacterium]|nr:succinyl-diaminopimelate desuccinylase [Geminicoccaceae bacterium]
MSSVDPVELTRALVRCPSVTPADAGAQAVLAEVLEGLGFRVELLRLGDGGEPAIDNLFARLGDGSPHLAFNGHTDVVPAGDDAAWSAGPFAAEIRDGWLYGRGAADMKGDIACFVAAIARYLERHGSVPGSLSLLITGDEEGPAVNGTVALLRWAEAAGHRFDACLVGEPTSVDELGDMAKIGRRGSLTVTLEARGRQGHVGYPHRADNAAHRLVRVLARLVETPLDEGTELFEPSSLQVTTIDIGNPASNVVPARARAVLNIRYNDSQSPASLKALVAAAIEAAGGRVEAACTEGANVFACPPGPLAALLGDSVEAVTGRRPVLSTSGGTSDARFIHSHCPVIEFGLIGQTIHQVDERVPLVELQALTAIYLEFLERYFGQ